MNSRFMVGPQGKTQDVFCKNAAHHNLPRKTTGASLSFQLCLRVGLTRTNFDGIEIEQPFYGWPEGQNTGKYFVIPLAGLNYKPHPCGVSYGPHCVRSNLILSNLVAIPGELPLPKSKAESGCKGRFKSAFLFHAGA